MSEIVLVGVVVTKNIFFKIYAFIRERASRRRGRGRERSRLPTEQSPMWGSIPGPQDPRIMT